MGAFFSYSLVSGLVLLAMYLIYKWMLAGEKQCAFNRLALWCIYAVALVSPLMLPGLRALRHTVSPLSAPGGMVEIGGLQAVPVVEDAPLLPRLMLWAYVAGVAVCMVLTFMTLLRLRSVIRSGRRSICGRYTLVVIPGETLAPFSWLRYIVMSEKDYAASGSVIITHETLHLDSAHWVDMLFAQIVCVMQWFNPAAWLMREELRSVHEYQADEAVLASGADPRSYQMLLIKKAVGARFPSIANSLNHSKLKKRVTMMYKSKSSVAGRLRALALIPAGALALLAVQIPVVASAIESASEATLTVAGDKDSKSSPSVKADKPAKGGSLDDVVVVGYGTKKKTPGDADARKPKQVNVTVVENVVKLPEDGAKPGEVVYYLDSKEVDMSVIEALSPDDIVRIDVSKDSNPAKVMITTKAAAPVQGKTGEESSGKVSFGEDEVLPVFPGGLEAMMKYLAMNVRYPEAAMKAGKEGKVVVKFIVAKDGKIESPEIVRGVSPELDAEALRVVGAMPDWIPVEHDGKPVACWFTLPVSFVLQSDAETPAEKK